MKKNADWNAKPWPEADKKKADLAKQDKHEQKKAGR